MKSYRGTRERLKPPSHLWIVLIIILVLAGIGFLALFAHDWMQYRKSDLYYTALHEVALPQAEAVAADTTPATPESSVDFASLQALNPDAAAWLEMPAIGVSLPVVQAQDDQTYLHVSFDGTSNPNGCLFFAVPQGGDVGLYRVLYGHNIHTGAMFGKLTQYKNESFYQQNPTFTLCTPAGDKTCRIFSCHAAVDGEDLYKTGRTAGDEYDAFLQQLKAASLYDTGVEVPSSSQVLTLSTCASSYGSGTDRFVVHAIVEP